MTVNPFAPPPPRRTDQTVGVLSGKVTRVTGSTCWWSPDGKWERGPARIPVELVRAADVAGGDIATVTPRPLKTGDTVTVYATRTTQFVLARY